MEHALVIASTLSPLVVIPQRNLTISRISSSKRKEYPGTACMITKRAVFEPKSMIATFVDFGGIAPLARVRRLEYWRLGEKE